LLLSNVAITYNQLHTKQAATHDDTTFIN